MLRFLAIILIDATIFGYYPTMEPQHPHPQTSDQEELEKALERPIWIPGAPKVMQPSQRQSEVNRRLYSALHEIEFVCLVVMLSAAAIAAGGLLGLGALLLLAFAG